jgi:hypothetical protein
MTDRKFQSNLQPYTLEVTIPTDTPIPVASVAEVRLIIRSHENQNSLVDEIITGYSLSAPSSLPQTLTLSWFEPTGVPLDPGIYESEVWITTNTGRQLKAPSIGYAPLQVHPSLARIIP